MDGTANTPQSNPIVELTGVTQRFPAVDGIAGPEVLRDVTWRVREGDSVAIIGPSGSGKSTLLNIIGGLARPTEGTVKVGGDDIYAQDDQALARFRNQHVGFVFQSHNLLPQCSALENVLVPTLVNRADPNRVDAPQRACELLDRVGLGPRMHHRPGQMSGGECQRAAVVRALINQPRIVLADEPTGSPDEESSEQLADLLIQLNREDGLTMITVTHSIALAARMTHGYELKRRTLVPRSAHEPAAPDAS